MSVMLDHVSLGVRDLERARRFYDAVMPALGYDHLYDMGGRELNYGPRESEDDFAIVLDKDAGRPSVGTHICFRATDRASVDAFYQAALANGGEDDGPPGLRPEYHPHYYAAFVLDPDGNRIEAVCHRNLDCG